MSHVTHQTVRLSKGKHASPEHGVCVMELASTLAGERFTDRPRAVCPTIAAFLRTYNDLVDDERRQDLYPYASSAVGTAHSGELAARRAELIVQWTEARARRRWAARERVCRRLRRGHPEATLESLARAAIRAAGRRGSAPAHAAILGLVDELLAISSVRSSPSWSPPPLVASVTPSSASTRAPARSRSASSRAEVGA